MAEARRRHDWDQTASLMTLIYNANRGRKKRAARLSDFHPCPDRRRERVPKGSIYDLKAAFIDRKAPRRPQQGGS